MGNLQLDRGNRLSHCLRLLLNGRQGLLHDVAMLVCLHMVPQGVPHALCLLVQGHRRQDTLELSLLQQGRSSAESLPEGIYQ